MRLVDKSAENLEAKAKQFGPELREVDGEVGTGNGAGLAMPTLTSLRWRTTATPLANSI